MVSIEDVKSKMHKFMLLEDDRIIDVAMGCVVANLIPGESVNLYIVGPPSSGKTEVIRSLGGFPRVEEVSSMTSHTLISGWDHGGKANKPSLIMRMKEEGKLMVALKDFTSVLTLRGEVRQEVLSQMREIADGRYAKPFGTGMRIEWTGKIGFIAGVTSVIDEFYATNQVLGERFLFYRIENMINPLALAEFSQKMAGREAQMRLEIDSCVAEYLKQFDGVPMSSVTLSKSMAERIRNLVCFVAGARSSVSRNVFTRQYHYMPQVESPPRLSKQITQLAAGIAIACGKDEVDDEVFGVIRKVGWDTVPGIRKKMLLTMWRDGLVGSVGKGVTAISEMTCLPVSTVKGYLEDLMVLGVVTRKINKGDHTWSISSMYGEFVRNTEHGNGEDTGTVKFEDIRWIKEEEYHDGAGVV